MIGTDFGEVTGLGLGGSSAGYAGAGCELAKLVVATCPHTASMMDFMFC